MDGRIVILLLGLSKLDPFVFERVSRGQNLDTLRNPRFREVIH